MNCNSFGKCEVPNREYNYVVDLGNNSPESVTWVKDLRSIFALLIRNYDKNIQAIEYLNDLIITNHLILSLFDSLKDCWNLNDGITTHIKK